MSGWSGFDSGLPPPRTSGSAMAEGEDQKSLSIQSPYIAPSFRYTKGILENPEAAGSKEPAEDECVVCLTGFAEGEFVCQLPRCRHSFFICGSTLIPIALCVVLGSTESIPGGAHYHLLKKILRRSC